MQASSRFELGHDLGAVGRWARLAFGACGLLWAGSVALGSGLAAETALYTLAILAAYVAAHWLLAERVLGKMNPWVGTVLLVGPAIVIPGIENFPAGLRLGMVAYFSASLLVNAATSYGGCEVLALPSLLFKRWYTVYCPLNAIDAAERAIAGESRGRTPKRAGG